MFFRSIAIVEASASHAAYGRFRCGTGGRLRLEQHATEAFVLEPEHEAEWPAKIAAAFQKLRARVGRPGPVVLVLPAHLMLAKFLRLPRVAAAQREKLVRFEAQQNIPYALTDVVWASTLVGETVTGSDVMLGAAKLDAVEPLCAAAAAAGFTPRCLLPGPLATIAAARLGPAGPEPGTLLVNLGARSTTLLLAEKNRTHLRSFLLGGNGVTTEIALARGCSFGEAELLKLSGRERALLDPAIASLALRLAQEITRSVLHFQRQAAAVAPRRVLLTGGGAGLPDLSRLLAKRMNLEVEQWAWGDAVEFAGDVDSVDVGTGARELTDLIGAAALQRDSGQPSLDLLPSRLRAREDFHRRQPWLALAAALAVTSLVPPIVHLRGVSATAHRQSTALERELVPLRKESARNRENLRKLGQIARQIAAWQDIEDRRALWLTLLADWQERLAKVGDVWLDRLQLSPAPGAGAGYAAPGAAPSLRLMVSGRMLDRANPPSKAGDDTRRRVKDLLESFAGSPFVAAVEGEAFENTQPGVLRFNFVLAGEPTRPF